MRRNPCSDISFPRLRLESAGRWSWPQEAQTQKVVPCVPGGPRRQAWTKVVLRGVLLAPGQGLCPKPGGSDGRAPLWAVLHEYHFPQPCPRHTGPQYFGLLLEAEGLWFQSHKQWEKSSMIRPLWRVRSPPPGLPPASVSSQPPLSRAMRAKGCPDQVRSTWHLVMVVSLLHHHH